MPDSSNEMIERGLTMCVSSWIPGTYCLALLNVCLLLILFWIVSISVFSNLTTCSDCSDCKDVMSDNIVLQGAPVLWRGDSWQDDSGYYVTLLILLADI